MAESSRWFAQARRLYDEPRHGLPGAAAIAARGGFAGGAEWMRRALVVSIAAWSSTAWLLPLAVIAFYAVEVRMVFAIPLALDGSHAPLRDSHALVSRSSAPFVATARVMRIAAEMLAGGFCGRGFVRSWCVGCLAVLLWYEQARAGCETSP